MRDRVDRLVAAFVAGDIERCAALTSETWPEPVDRPTEGSPQEHWRTLGATLLASLTDRAASLSDVQEADGRLTAAFHAEGTFAHDLWDFPATGARIAMDARLVAEPDGDRVRWWLEEWNPALNTLRDMGIVPQPEFMDRPLAYPVQIDERVFKWAFNGGFFEKPCSHLHEIGVTTTNHPRCATCDAMGVEYPAVRMCLTCGHVGCCDTSVNKHARKHFEETGHPLMRSVRLQESWVWCYVDNTVMSAKW